MKIMFLQLYYDMYGGLETVNHTLTKQFIKDGYLVKIDCLYKSDKNEIIANIDYPKDYMTFELKRPSYKKMIQELLSLKLSSFWNNLKKCFMVKKNNSFAYRKLKQSINEYQPDWLIVSNIELIKQVPKKYLSKCLLPLHSGCEEYLLNKRLKKIVYKYQSKIYKFIWLTEGFMHEGEKHGLTKGTFIYNPVRIKTKEKSKLNNKNIVYVGRLEEKVKRVYLLTDIFLDFNKNNPQWHLNIYGNGNDTKIKNNPNIHLNGATDNVKEKLLKADILALTSAHEGFPMVILESYECGVPVIVFNYKTSCKEIVDDKKTGFIIEMDNEKEYVEKLNLLSHNPKLLKEMGKNAQEYVKRFYPEVIAQKWYDLFRGRDD